MRTTAELDGPVSGIDNSDCRAVFFTKERHRAGLLCFFHRHFCGIDRQEVIDGFIDQSFHFLQLRRGHCLKVGKVKAQHIFVDHRACLFYMTADHFSERLLQQMGRGMISG